MSKKWIVVLSALLSVHLMACDDESNDKSKCTTEQVTVCVQQGKTIDSNCQCVELTMTCTTDQIAACSQQGKSIDANCQCVGQTPTCTTDQIAACAQQGKSIDANCQCVGQTPTCTTDQIAACTQQGKSIDANCQCVGGSGESCTTGQIKCDGSKALACLDNVWTEPIDCAGLNMVCVDGAGCKSSSNTCDASVIIACTAMGGKIDSDCECQITVPDCTQEEKDACTDGSLNEKCECVSTPSDDIPATCTKKISPAICGKDGNAYFCGDTGYYLGKTCDVSNPCYVCDNGYGGCGDKATECKSGGGDSDELCTASSTSGCKKNCSNDKSVGYYWNGSKLVTVNCANNDCIIDSQNHVVCESDGSSSGSDLPADVPSTCTKKVSPAYCASDGNAYFCGDDGYYFGKKCDTSNPCYVCDNGYGGCGDKATECKSGGGDSDELCTASSTSGCKKNCVADQSVGYYWSGSKLVTVNCPNKDCIIDSQDHVVCEGAGESGGDEVDTTVGASCNAKTYPGACKGDKGFYCGNDGTIKEKSCVNCSVKSQNSVSCGSVSDELCTASSTSGCKKNCVADQSVGYYWSGTQLMTVTCPNHDCIIDSQNHVVCEGAGGGENTEANPYGSNRTEGASCDPSKYYGACSDDLTKRYYCDTTRKTVVEKICNSGCDVTSLKLNSSKCNN